MSRVASHLKNGDSKIVIDDVRFQNEAELIKRMGGEMWMIVRPSVQKSTTHESEGALDRWESFDQAIINDGTIADFRAKIDKAAGC
jgi:hypothetical protein